MQPATNVAAREQHKTTIDAIKIMMGTPSYRGHTILLLFPEGTMVYIINGLY